MPSTYRPDYFEAVIQIRPNNDKVIDFIKKQILNRNDVFISKEKKLKTGIDIYISSQKYVRALARKLKSSFKGKALVTYTLHTEDRLTSKKKYRATLLFRLDE